MNQQEQLASILEAVCKSPAPMCPAKALYKPCPFDATDIHKCKAITKEDWLCLTEKTCQRHL